MVCDLEKPNQIGPAIGNASIVICCIGASEKEIFDITGPYRIDYLATKNLVEAGKKIYCSVGGSLVVFNGSVVKLFLKVLELKSK